MFFVGVRGGFLVGLKKRKKEKCFCFVWFFGVFFNNKKKNPKSDYLCIRALYRGGVGTVAIGLFFNGLSTEGA